MFDYTNGFYGREHVGEDVLVSLTLLMAEIKRQRKKNGIENDTLKTSKVIQYIFLNVPRDEIVEFLNFNGKKIDKAVAIPRYYAILVFNKYTQANLKNKEEKGIINYNVPLNEYGNNGNIEITIFDDETMRSLGFTDYNKKKWYRSTKIFDSISFGITIDKENPKNFTIDVLDDDFCQPYDYQAWMKEDRDFKPYRKCHFEVQKIMQQLIKVGIVKGYVLGDYI